MKKQLFLLTSLLIASTSLYPDTCNTNTSCSTKSKSCKDVCVPEHGKTFRRVENAFQNATPMYASMFNSNVIRNLDAEDKHGGMEITVFGGKNTKKSEAACYFFPYGHAQYTFDGSVADTVKTTGAVKAFTNVQVTNVAATTGTGGNAKFQSSGNTVDGTVVTGAELTANPLTFKVDTNKDTSKILPWNFGITFAALFEPARPSGNNELIGTGLITNPEFKSTVAPTYHFSHVGAGMALRYHFSDDKQGFFGSLSTSVEHVRSRICLNESVTTKRKALTEDNYPYIDYSTPSASVPLSPGITGNAGTGAGTLATATATPVGGINAAYIQTTNPGTGIFNQGDPTGTFFPVDQAGLENNPHPVVADVTEAFAQARWKYGKIDCEQKITRLADIELAVGYQWLCSDCASSNWYVGVVIPTGNKPCADYVAPAVVGNGQHGGIMGGSSLELMLSENEDRSIWYRLDTNCRYLFRNTQKRSFDLKGNEWSRYMMVWENKEAYEAAVTYVNSNIQSNRNYQAGINVFTHDMKVKPRFQSRINQAVYFNSECFRVEMGWNVFARTKECVELSCPWDKAPAFADSSDMGGVALNNNRTIYNDAQGMAVNSIPSLAISNGTNPLALSGAAADSSLYDSFTIKESDINLDSAATPASIVHTPYATVGYAWDSECKPALSLGAQYEFSQGNTALNKWMVWGKFEFAF